MRLTSVFIGEVNIGLFTQLRLNQTNSGKQINASAGPKPCEAWLQRHNQYVAAAGVNCGSGRER
jgi:hypothetical protein